MYTDTIFENYGHFVTENREMVNTPRDAMQMISTDASFYSYIDSLTEGLDEMTSKNVLAVCEREREVFLENSANVGPTSTAIGYAVK